MDNFIDDPEFVGSEEYSEKEKLKMLRDRLETPLVIPDMSRADSEEHIFYIAGLEVSFDLDDDNGFIKGTLSPYTENPVKIFIAHPFDDDEIDEEISVWGIEYGEVEDDPIDEIVILAETSNHALSTFTERYPYDYFKLRSINEDDLLQLMPDEIEGSSNE